MMISVAGVLVAGSAAALVNTQVLDSSASPASLSIDAAQQTRQSQQTAPTTTAASIVPAPTVTQPAVVTTSPAAVPSATQVNYAIGSAGTVTLDTAGDVLTIVAVMPAEGWTVIKSESEDAINVEVRLEAGDQRAEFHANLLFGVVTVSTETDDATSTSNSVDDHGGDNSGSSGSSGSGGSGSSGSSGHGGGDGGSDD